MSSKAYYQAHKPEILARQKQRRIDSGWTPKNKQYDESAVVLLFDNGKLTEAEVATRTGVPEWTVRRILKRHGLHGTRTWKLDDVKRAEIVTAYQAGETTAQIGERYGISDVAVSYTLRKAGVQARGNSDSHRTLALNEAAFDDLGSEEALYWLGFLTADGHVGNNQVDVQLQAEDKEHLEKFKIFLGSGSPVREYMAKGFGKEHPAVRIRCSSQKITSRLVELGFTKERKNVYTEWVAKLSDEKFRHWLRGMWDGDGWVGIKKANHGANEYLYVGLCGWRELLEPVRNRLVKVLGVSSAALTEQVKIVKFEWEGSHAVTVAGWLYRDAKVSMNRKREVWEEWSKAAGLSTF